MAELLASPGRQRDGHFSLRSRIQELWQQREDEEEKKRRENAGGGAKDAEGKAVAGESGDTEQAALNWAFEKLPVSLFPPVASGQVIEVASDASVADAIHLLSRHGILSAPVRNVDAPADSSWIDRYLGLLDFAGIVLWVLGRVSAGRNGRVGCWGRTMGSVRAGDF
ncbi:unnamed protein product [Closterium sp. NIES-64]|nr:unnamed protein product [Closterium sp. NIES-64]CAI5974233.1 unnamed protein product [Closterium sp. NIES-65]